MKELNYLDITKTGQGHIKLPSATGIHPDMGVGTAQQIQTNIHESDSTPYVFRKTPYNSTRESGDIVGASVPWNQLCKNGNFVDTVGWYLQNSGLTSMSASNNVLTVTIAGGSTSQAWLYGVYKTDVVGEATHKYLVRCDVEPSVATTFKFELGGAASYTTPTISANSKTTVSFINTASTYNKTLLIYPFSAVNSVAAPAMTVKYSNVIVIDLTLALGSSIADYIYTLESGTAGAGVAKLKEWGFFTSPYYAYNAGGIESVNVSKHRMTGLNQWDEEYVHGRYAGNNGVLNTAFTTIIASKNKIPVLPNTTYYIKVGGAYPTHEIVYYDGAGNWIKDGTIVYVSGTFTTPSNCYYINFNLGGGYGATYNHDICINISDPAVNGTYEPYTTYEYALDSDLTLRGILKLDGSNNLYADGDVYHSDGTVDRNWAERAYQAGDASDGSTMITDGTTTVYKLQTPTTETANPYNEVQVCSPYGTEEYVDAGVAAGTRDVAIPVGHSTEYMKNIVGAIEGIPLPPTTNGNFKLRCTVASGVPTYSWVSE